MEHALPIREGMFLKEELDIKGAALASIILRKEKGIGEGRIERCMRQSVNWSPAIQK